MEVVGTDRLFVIAGASPRFQSKSVCSSSCAPYADVCVSRPYTAAPESGRRVSGPRHNYQALLLRHRRLRARFIFRVIRQRIA